MSSPILDLPRPSALDLFSGKNGDKDYKAFKDELCPWHKHAKVYWNQLAKQYQSYLDTNFVSQFPQQCIDRLWELTFIQYIASQSTQGLQLVHFPVKKNTSKPDFCFSYQGQPFHCEATCAGGGDPSHYPNINATLKEIDSLVRPMPISEYRERLTSAIKVKIDKYGSSYRSQIGENAGFIIAVLMAKIPFFNQPHIPSVDISCIFPCAYSATIPIYSDLKGGQVSAGKSYHAYQESFKKKNSANSSDINTAYFSDPEYAHISAILISHDGHAFFPDVDKYEFIRWGKCRNDFLLIRNPFAKIPLPVDVFPVYRETSIQINAERFQISINEYN